MKFSCKPPRFLMIPLSLLLSAADVPAKFDRLQPGQWRIVVDLGADAANGERLSTPESSHEEQIICLSKDNLASLLVDGVLPDGCHLHQFHAAQGEIEFTAICPPDEDGVSLDFVARGTYTSDRTSMRIDARAESEGNQATMSGTAIATREGACSVGN